MIHLRSSLRNVLLRVSIEPIAEPPAKHVLSGDIHHKYVATLSVWILPAGLMELFLRSKSWRTALDDKALHSAWMPDSNVPIPFHSRPRAVNECDCLLPSDVPGSRIPAPSSSCATCTAPRCKHRSLFMCIGCSL
jgi:hypothetical protein